MIDAYVGFVLTLGKAGIQFHFISCQEGKGEKEEEEEEPHTCTVNA